MKMYLFVLRLRQDQRLIDWLDFSMGSVACFCQETNSRSPPVSQTTGCWNNCNFQLRRISQYFCCFMWFFLTYISLNSSLSHGHLCVHSFCPVTSHDPPDCCSQPAPLLCPLFHYTGKCQTSGPQEIQPLCYIQIFYCSVHKTLLQISTDVIQILCHYSPSCAEPPFSLLVLLQAPDEKSDEFSGEIWLMSLDYNACNFYILQLINEKNFPHFPGNTIEDDDMSISTLLEKANANLGTSTFTTCASENKKLSCLYIVLSICLSIYQYWA